MQNYDFRTLNDKEFEVLVNDLLSEKEGVTVDRFKAGKDKGIDGRFFTAGDTEVIIQSKHWIKSGIKQLIRKLKKDEVAKVKKLNPKRYIVATSLELSADNKEEIKTAFSPYIISEGDILGRENLNDLLAKNDKIEQKHYKLWLSSSNVLDFTLNNALIGRSEALHDDIISATPTYIITENHNRALEKLKALHSVVITGEGGIGKTSLAQQLVHHYMKHGFELCAIEHDISEAEAIFKKGKKQVFYFDDFLGRNYLMAIEGHKDSHVLNFMDRVGKDSSKRFILTSRSTVLNQGKKVSDLLDIRKIDQKEYEITIQSLSNLDRARILYNHIWHSNLGEEYIEQLYVDKRYTKITKHQNYNPRIISFITDADRIKDTPQECYWDYITDKLDNPKDIWAHVFDEQIDDLTRVALCLVALNGANIYEYTLQESFRERVIADGLASHSDVNHKYRRMLKVAVGSVLQRTVITNNSSTKLDLFNPSIADFIVPRFKDDAFSLKAYFSCLNTVDSLQNLKSLHVIGLIDDKIYYEVLEALALKKINSVFLENKMGYCLTLSDMVVTSSKVQSREIIKSILGNCAVIISDAVSELYVAEICNIIKFSLQQSSQEFKEAAFDFILKSTDELFLEHDDLVIIDDLINHIPDLNEDKEIELRDSIKSGLERYWNEEISDVIIGDNVLGEYMHIAEEHEALACLQDYIYDKLFGFDFSEDEIRSIAGGVDIKEAIFANIEAASHEGNYNSSGIASHNPSSGSDDAQIDDLFHRT